MSDSFYWKLLDMLRCLDEILPPPPKCHHSIQRNRYGSDEDGWEEKLALVAVTNAQFCTVFFEEGDFEKSHIALAEEIKQCVNTMLGEATK